MKLAEQSIAQKPGEPKALEILAQAQFAGAAFQQAAVTYRLLLDAMVALNYPPPVSAPQALHDYADALAAAQAGQAGVEAFEGWLTETGRYSSQPEFQADVAGLRLLAGDDRQASAVLERVRSAVIQPAASNTLGTITIPSLTKASPEPSETIRIPPAKTSDTGNVWPPEAIGRLGHWYYRAAQYPAAAELVGRAVQERPGDLRLQTALGWALLELRNHEAALMRFQAAPQSAVSVGGLRGPADRGTVRLEPWFEGEQMVGRMITLWRAANRDAAVAAFAESVEPRRALWLNERWVTMLYSPLVARSIDEIRLEREARLSARRAQVPSR